jgi:hypothetical protein
MKRFYLWIKIFGFFMATFAIFLTIYVWKVHSGTSPSLDLISPPLLDLSILDWLIAIVCLFFSVFSFVMALEERRRWENFTAGIPLAVMNTVMVSFWWIMERGEMDLTFTLFTLTIVMVANVIYTLVFTLFSPQKNSTFKV